MEPCTTYQNTHHQSTVVIGSQQGKTYWPFMFKLMSNINQRILVIYRIIIYSVCVCVCVCVCMCVT